MHTDRGETTRVERPSSPQPSKGRRRRRVRAHIRQVTWAVRQELRETLFGNTPADDGPLEKLEASRIPRSREEKSILWSLVR
jgi:hypothetical protein